MIGRRERHPVHVKRPREVNVKVSERSHVVGFGLLIREVDKSGILEFAFAEPEDEFDRFVLVMLLLL